jgi:hypothetical protein
VVLKDDIKVECATCCQILLKVNREYIIGDSIIWKDPGGASVKLLSWHLPVDTEETYKSSNRMDGNLAEI